ncbi:MAG: cytochrome c oxidase subunit 3 family protein, partial [Ignavibacterium sp.]|nr:cytochrome c oxidase subunit 3 family protein [Ignavibacterium sp.]
MGMWLFLFTELILFGGMFILYSIYRYMYPDAFHLAAKE